MKPLQSINNPDLSIACKTGIGFCGRTNSGVLMEKIVQDLSSAWGRQVDLRTRVEYSSLRLSEQCITGVVTELLDNAFRYSRKGTTVAVSSRDEFRKSVIQMENTASLDDYMEVMKLVNEEQAKATSGRGISRVLSAAKAAGGSLSIFYKNQRLRFTLSFPV